MRTLGRGHCTAGGAVGEFRAGPRESGQHELSQNRGASGPGRGSSAEALCGVRSVLEGRHGLCELSR